MRELAGKVAVITGAASGIGLALSRRLGADGMRVMISDVDEPALADAARSLMADGIEVATTVTDVSDPDSVDALARATLDRFGGVHVVCNNAGVSRGGPSWEIPLPTWNWVMGVNLFGIVHGIRSFVPHLIAQGEGHVVNTASVAGLVAARCGGPYSASKHAAVAVSESLYHDLAAIGSPVGVSVLCPGPVRTRIHESFRHWQDRFGPRPSVQDSPAVAEWRRESAVMVESGLDPALIATAVRDAIVGNRFWILTHPEYANSLLSRYYGLIKADTPCA
ncbi:MAG: SDR family NAD(P)-dependent oxidoreductase [Streptosporangiaceae bacterium]|nr:SDR family NAD(P)-dependent oxidoreductase [Streptosporangiaceae bacterium]